MHLPCPTVHKLFQKKNYRNNPRQNRMKDINKREPNSSICIHPIDACIRPDEIKAEFKEFGEIKEIRIPVDFETREPRGFAYVE